MIPRTTLKLKHIDLAGIKLPEASGGRREGEWWSRFQYFENL